MAALTASGISPTLRFERTIGDEVQGAMASAADALHATVTIARLGGWSIGIGVGDVELPLPDSTRQLRGAAPIAARAAVEHARRRSEPRISIRGDETEACAAAEAVLRLYGALLATRSNLAWRAIDLLRAGSTHARAGATLGVTRQAVGQRLEAARWDVDEGALRVISHLFSIANNEHIQNG